MLVNEFCTLVKNDENTSHIPIILLCENVTPDIIIGDDKTGAAEFLAKPFNKVDLLMKIKNLISASRKFRGYCTGNNNGG